MSSVPNSRSATATISSVAAESATLPTAITEFGISADGRAGDVLVDVVDDDGGAVLGEPGGDRLADAAAGTRDERDAALQGPSVAHPYRQVSSKPASLLARMSSTTVRPARAARSTPIPRLRNVSLAK